MNASAIYDCADSVEREQGVHAAVTAIRSGELIVLPTDTVYGVGADAFSPDAVARLLAAKKRGRDMPVPVLVGRQDMLSTLALTDLNTQAFIEAFWPGGLTLICNQQPSLQWDLGDAGGTVALRMPDHDAALEVLQATGPLAVSSANLRGGPAPQSVGEAREQLADTVAVYLDAGYTSDNVPSTIVDMTASHPRVVRHGALSMERLRSVVPDVFSLEDENAN